jgi:hypothetical protein
MSGSMSWAGPASKPCWRCLPGKSPGRRSRARRGKATSSGTALSRAGFGQRMLEILLQGVSTRRYRRVIPEMADTVGVSKSTVSRDSD